MNNVILLTLFPKTVYRSSLERSLTDIEILAINNESKDCLINFGNKNSKNQNVLELPELAELKLFLMSHLEQYINTVIVPKNNVEIYITQSWLNFTSPGQYHHKHNHPNSYISGVFYVDANLGKDSLTFFDETYHQIAIESKEYHSLNSTSWKCNVKTGDLLLFPSHMTHGVDESSTKDNLKERISIAFNTFIKGTIGEKSHSTELTLR